MTLIRTADGLDVKSIEDVLMMGDLPSPEHDIVFPILPKPSNGPPPSADI